MDFSVPANHRVKIKGNENVNKYLARNLFKKLWNVRVIMIPTVIGMLRTVHEGFEKRLPGLELRGKMETIHTSKSWISARILRRVLET